MLQKETLFRCEKKKPNRSSTRNYNSNHNIDHSILDLTVIKLYRLR